METVAFWTLITGIISVIISLTIKHRFIGSRFNFDELLLGADGRTSKSAFLLLMSWALLSYVFIYMTFKGNATIDHFWAYGVLTIVPFVLQLLGATIKDIIQIFSIVRGSESKEKSDG